MEATGATKMNDQIKLFSVAVMMTLLAAGITAQDDDSKNGAGEETAKVETPFYGNTTCPVSGEDIDHEVYAQVGNQKVYTCCKKCKGKVEADPEKFVAKAYPEDAAVEAGNTTCPESGEAVDPEVFTVWQGHKVHLCCAKCEAGFLEAPERKLTLALHPGLVELGNTHCLVMKDEAVDPSSFFIYGDKLIGSCCADCAGKFAKDPEKYLAAFKAGGDDDDDDGGMDDDDGDDDDDDGDDSGDDD
jgi:YHS domain-containing protein